MHATLTVWGSRLALMGASTEERQEIEATFAGAVDECRDGRPELTIQRMPALPGFSGELPADSWRPRHRAGYGSRYYFLDGTVFDDRVQQRDVGVIAESSGMCVYGFPGTLMVSSRRQILLFADRLPHMLLSDIVESWLLWKAREQAVVMAHGSSWVRDGAVEILAADSGGGKTTELFKQVQRGARFFSNDRVALRVSGGRLEARSFPQPVNVAFGTIRSIGLPLPVFDDDLKNKVRLSAAEVAERYHPDYQSWIPVRAVYARSMAALERNVHWEGDPHHPFWNRVLRPRSLDARALRAQLAALLAPEPLGLPGAADALEAARVST